MHYGYQYGGISGSGGGGGNGFDADYNAVLNYATGLGYTLPSASQQIAQNNLLVSLKSAGIWAKLDTFGNFTTDGSSSFALIDWKRLILYTAVNSPTFTANQGFLGDGTSSYINANYQISTQAVNYLTGSSSIGAYVQQISTNTGNQLAGSGIGADYLSPNQSNSLFRGATFGSAVFNATTKNTTPSIVSVNRPNTTILNHYRGATKSADISAISTGTAATNQFSFLAAGGVQFDNSRIGMGWAGGSLEGDMANFVSIWATYLAEL